ncbi:MAG: peptide ABC transporter substrate-binding protein [Clostridia bacterium]|nr:peptide ABC transporter substrate-binding protein [Clostridia bacterium]
MKKKILSSLLAVCLLFSFPMLPFAAAYDIDGDGQTAASDARLTLRYAIGLEDESGGAFWLADADSDGYITAQDARLILRAALGMDEASSVAGTLMLDPKTEWYRYDNLISQIKSETDYAKRVELMHEAEDILMSTWCILPIYYYNDIYLQKSYVSGIYSSAYATKYFMYAKLAGGRRTLRINLASEPDFLDPALNSSVDGACLAANSFSGLYTYDEYGKCVPACAESCSVSSDGLKYTVKLKRGLRWSDGSSLTAADFEYSWKRAASEETAADYGYMFSGFKGYPNKLAVHAKDGVTLEFELEAPCPFMEDLMAFPTFYPVKRQAVESYPFYRSNPGGWCEEAGFVSNGAFVCTGWSHDYSMTYEKNPYWYDADSVEVEKLEFMLSVDDNSIYSAFNAGYIDFADSAPTYEIKNLIDNPELHIVDELGTYYCAFNQRSSLFNGKTAQQAADMRHAFSILIDREYICENIGQTGQVAASSFIPLGMADGNGGVFKADPDDNAYYDPHSIVGSYEKTVSEARELLKRAGYRFGADGKLSPETPIWIEYLTNWSTGHVAIAQAIQQDLSVLGIEMTITQLDWNVFLEERKQGNFDIAREGWIADFNDPINMLEMWVTYSGNNDCQFGR